MILPLMISIIFHTKGHSTEVNVSYVVDFYVSGDVHISHFGDKKKNFITSLHFALRVMY